MRRALTGISTRIVERNKGASNIVLIGILRRGAPLADVSPSLSNRSSTSGRPWASSTWRCTETTTLSATRSSAPTELPYDVTGKDIVLVDLIIFTGRTVRAAIRPLYGPRPSRQHSARGAAGSRSPGAPVRRITSARTCPPPARSMCTPISRARRRGRRLHHHGEGTDVGASSGSTGNKTLSIHDLLSLRGADADDIQFASPFPR